MNSLTRILTIMLAVVILTVSCSSVKPTKYRDDNPHFAPFEYFVGKSRGQGMFFARSGEVQRRFEVVINGYIKDDKLYLDEQLNYLDGEKLKRVYEITKLSDAAYQAKAAGVVGVAKIDAYGNVLRWKYTLQTAVNDDVWELDFDDWMYLQNNDLVLNRAYVTKFGIRIGEVFMALQKVHESS